MPPTRRPAAAPAPAPRSAVEARPRDPVARVERSGPLAVITLDDPATRNALGEALLASLDAALDALEDDADVRLVALTGAGRVFCAGRGDPASTTRCRTAARC